MDEIFVTIDLPEALPIVHVSITPSGPIGPQGPEGPSGSGVAPDLTPYLTIAQADAEFISYAALSTESSERQNADIVQTSDLNAEMNARSSKDDALSLADSTEVTARSNGDSGLQAQINTIKAQVAALQASASAPVTYTLTVTSDAGGSVAENAIGPYAAGTTVIVTPTPDASHTFNDWTLDGVTSSGNPLTVTMNANRVLVAHWTALPAPISQQRVYADSSPWNTPLPLSPTIHAQSAAMVAAITDKTILGDNNFQENTGVGLHFTSDPTQFAFPVYWVEPSVTGTRPVHYSGLFSDVSSSGVESKFNGGGNVTTPFKGEEVPSPGSDGSFEDIDAETSDMWGGWQLVNTGGVISCTNLYVLRNGMNGSGQLPVGFTARGPGMDYAGGTIMAHEMIAALAAPNGDLGHRLGFAYDIVTPRWVEPWATKSDGQYSFPGMPEGAQLQFDPTITEAQLRSRIADGVSAGGISLTEQEILMALVILRTGQKYGFVIVDHSGQRPGKIIPEGDATANWGAGSIPAYNTHVVWYLNPAWLRVLDFTDTNGLAANMNSGVVQWLDHFAANQTFNASTGGALVRAETGGTYSFGRGDKTLYGASNGELWMSCPLANAGTGVYLLSVQAQDVISTHFFRPIALPAGAAHEFYVQLRASADTRTFYQLRGRIDPATLHLKLTIQSMIAGTLSALNTEFDTGVVYNDLSKYIGVTFQAQGTAQRARVWISTTQDETDAAQPSTWQVSVTNSASALQIPGGCGISYSAASGSTALPAKFFTTFWRGVAL